MQHKQDKDISQLRQRLRALYEELGGLLEAFMGRETMLKGSIYETFRRCGKPSCECATNDEKRHWGRFITLIEGKKRRTLSIPKEIEKEAVRSEEAYRRFRLARARWIKLMKESRILLNRIEEGRLVSWSELEKGE